jgi:hypothetical protein
MESCPSASYHRCSPLGSSSLAPIEACMCPGSAALVPCRTPPLPSGFQVHAAAPRQVPPHARNAGSQASFFVTFPSACLAAAIDDPRNKRGALRIPGIVSRASLSNPGFPVPLYNQALSPLLSASCARDKIRRSHLF